MSQKLDEVHLFVAHFRSVHLSQPYDDESERKWPGGDNGHTAGAKLGIGAGQYDHIWDTTKAYAPRKK